MKKKSLCVLTYLFVLFLVSGLYAQEVEEAEDIQEETSDEENQEETESEAIQKETETETIQEDIPEEENNPEKTEKSSKNFILNSTAGLLP